MSICVPNLFTCNIRHLQIPIVISSSINTIYLVYTLNMFITFQLHQRNLHLLHLLHVRPGHSDHLLDARLRRHLAVHEIALVHAPVVVQPRLAAAQDRRLALAQAQEEVLAVVRVRHIARLARARRPRRRRRHAHRLGGRVAALRARIEHQMVGAALHVRRAARADRVLLAAGRRGDQLEVDVARARIVRIDRTLLRFRFGHDHLAVGALLQVAVAELLAEVHLRRAAHRRRTGAQAHGEGAAVGRIADVDVRAGRIVGAHVALLRVGDEAERRRHGAQGDEQVCGAIGSVSGVRGNMSRIPNMLTRHDWMG